MREPGRALAAAALACMAQTALAGPLEDGDAALKNGDGWTALLKWRPLAESGSADASHRLGKLYAQGRGPGVPSDQNEARRWWQFAVEQGHARAAVDLGLSYYWGIGFPPAKDVREAVKWWRVAFLRGNTESAYVLGLSYKDGNPPDLVRAHMWFRIHLSIQGATLSKGMGDVMAGVAAKLQASQIELAQQMAKTCLTSEYKECGEPARESEYVRIAHPSGR